MVVQGQYLELAPRILILHLNDPTFQQTLLTSAFQGSFDNKINKSIELING